ncbi:AP-5 complex subunit mu-1 [Sphaerodactylus townsendi]|uniref:AP-5 complex subunit mu-1 n=1 Tax=Sphaerodactylus townsendi TaxID=933632 RepID=UPI00202639DE|nr:AP-5 complex subunit mu-1 [Sphaerodactylus townsendi]
MDYSTRSLEWSSKTQIFFFLPLKCDIEGAAPNVSISLNLPANGSPLQDILVHPCVTSLDSAVLTSSSVDAVDDSAFSGPYKFPLTPPPDQFNLCYYTSQVPVPPILGFYQLKEEESQWKLTVQLKLHESVKNSFEYCEARIPFFNRGPITHLEYKITHGQLEVSKEKSLLVWVIGKKKLLFLSQSEEKQDGTPPLYRKASECRAQVFLKPREEPPFLARPRPLAAPPLLPLPLPAAAVKRGREVSRARPSSLARRSGLA